jgi:hypothetical protein
LQDWGRWVERALVGPVAFEILDTLVELLVGEMEEGAGFLMLPIVVFPFLHMLNLNVHGEAFGYEVQLVAKSFHQHAAVALNLFDPVIYLLESSI